MPRPDDLVERLAEVARDDEALSAASERKLTGNFSADDDALVAGMPAFLTEPISETRRAAVVDAIEARLAASSDVPGARAGRITHSNAANVRRLGVAAAISAIAAGTFIWVMRPPSPDAPLSSYDLRIEGGIQSERSVARAHSATLRIRPGSTLQVSLRPSQDVRESVRARVFVQRSGQTRVDELDTKQEQSPAGSLKVIVSVPDALPDSGSLLIDVGRRDAVAAEAPGSAPASKLDRAQRFRLAFVRSP